MFSSAGRNCHRMKTSGSVGDQMAFIHDEPGPDAADAHIAICRQTGQILELNREFW
jgi:hypothetical protein